MKRPWILSAIFVSGMVFVFSGGADAIAQDKFPTKPMEWVIPTSPGSGSSVQSQLMANLGGKIIGQPINVLHKPGGNGNETYTYTFRQSADGYTIGNYVGSSAGYMNFPEFKHKVTDFIYVMEFMKTVYCLFVHKDSQFKTIQDLIQYAKANPGKLDIGSNKVGSVHFINLEKFARAAGIRVNNIPYKGVGESMKDVMGKHLTAALAQPFSVIPKKGYLRTLLVFNESRLSQMPDVPVPADLGYKYPMFHQIYGIFLKKGTPPERTAKIKDTFMKVMKAPEFLAFGNEAGNEIEFRDSKEFTEIVMRNTQDAREILLDLKAIK
jgi:tripartite-type tricarboxylate transporter receptor subunit TctC